ncbi:putative nucleic acid-binding Zn ribbon protein [Bacillus sp. F9_6S_D1_P_5]
MNKKKSRVKNEIILWILTAVVLIIAWYFFQR